MASFIRLQLMILLWTISASCLYSAPIDGKKYLQKYGYLTPASTYAFFAGPSLQDAIKIFQKDAGLTVTGVLDDATKKMMAKPRCGAPNHIFTLYAFSNNIWSKNDLTYSFASYTQDLSRQKTEEIIKQAFKMWSDVSAVSFKKVNGLSSDILIKFATRDHGDVQSFDGNGGTLAHAFPPPDGDIHFDDDEFFTTNKSTNADLLWVAAHEIGHALGLPHSNVPGSIMIPYFPGYQPNLKLHADDIAQVRTLYGAKASTTQVPASTTQKVCKDNQPLPLCGAWRNSGFCAHHVRVRFECSKTCAVCK